MPTYEYRCESCGMTLEVVQRFSEPSLTTCESCGGVLRKVYAPVGIVFKGSGFYKNDSRTSRSAPPSRAAGDTNGDGAASGSKDSGAATSTSQGTTKDPAPAAAAPSAAAPAKGASSPSTGGSE